MSYVVEILVICNAPGCGESLRFRHTNRGGLSKTMAGYMAASEGWDVQGGMTARADPKVAFCPKHVGYGKK